MQFLDLEGLKTLWTKIQSNTNTAIKNIGLKAIATSGKASDVTIDAISGVTGATAQAALANIYSQLTAVKSTADAAKKSADGWVDKFVSAGKYDSATKNLVLTIANGSDVNIPVGALLDNVVYTGSNIGLTGYTEGTSSADITAADTLNAAISKIINKIKNIGGTAGSAVQTVKEGTNNGEILVDGDSVKVHGLGSAAYTASSAYATATQGTKADNIANTLAKQNVAITEKSDTAAAKVVFTLATSATATKDFTISAISDTDIDNIVNPKL